MAVGNQPLNTGGQQHKARAVAELVKSGIQNAVGVFGGDVARCAKVAEATISPGQAGVSTFWHLGIRIGGDCFLGPSRGVVKQGFRGCGGR
eukprot:5070528-Lingulodinium_polyedra.AAC.1